MKPVDLVLGIDPGKTSGWALVTLCSSPKLILCGAIKLKDETPSDLIRVLAVARGSLCAIETQYVAINPASTISLAQSAGRWIEAATVRGLEVSLINPTAWHAAELGMSRAKRPEIKSATACKVAKLYGPVIPGVSLDAIDAILIARYAAVERFYGMVKK